MICAICMNAGGTGSYWENFGSKELKCKELVGTPRRPNVARLGQQTSRRLNVATLQRRDVSAISTSPSLKERMGPEFEGSKIVRRRAWKSKQKRPRS